MDRTCGQNDGRLTKQICSANVEGCRSHEGLGPRHTFHDQIDRVLSEGDVRSLIYFLKKLKETFSPTYYLTILRESKDRRWSNTAR